MCNKQSRKIFQTKAIKYTAFAYSIFTHQSFDRRKKYKTNMIITKVKIA